MDKQELRPDESPFNLGDRLHGDMNGNKPCSRLTEPSHDIGGSSGIDMNIQIHREDDLLKEPPREIEGMQTGSVQMTPEMGKGLLSIQKSSALERTKPCVNNDQQSAPEKFLKNEEMESDVTFSEMKTDDTYLEQRNMGQEQPGNSSIKQSNTDHIELSSTAISEVIDTQCDIGTAHTTSGQDMPAGQPDPSVPIVDPAVQRLKNDDGSSSPKHRPKKLKKQLSVRFADEDHSADLSQSTPSETKPEEVYPNERRRTFSQGRKVREQLRESVLRWLHPDSYEMDAFPLDQGVQSYQTFDWDSTTRYKSRPESTVGTASEQLSSPCGSIPPPLTRLSSIVSALSEDEVDLYRRRGNRPSLCRVESVMSTMSEPESENVFSDSMRNPFRIDVRTFEDTSGHPYNLVYAKPKPFDEKDRVPFLEEDQVFVHITDIGRISGSSEKTLNPNLYFIEIHHGQCMWSVRRRYHHFFKLHEEILFYKATLKIPFGDQNHRVRSRAYREKSQKRLPHFPRTPDALVRSKNMAKRMSQLQKYLQAVLDNHVLRNHPVVLEFFEVSELSFIDELGLKAKEGWVSKKSGGRHVPSGICSCCPSCKIKARYSKRWLVTKDSFIAYMRPTDGTVRTVMLFDRSFTAVCGKDDTGRSKCLILSNQHRTLRVRCTSKLAAREWMVEILQAAKKSDYTRPHPYGSFAPVRANNFAHWFVDGELYFQSVANAMAAAQDEIFITDWWFNPDIFLKRPAVEGNMWKVDQLLKRKAKQGVKIFILLYKEVELALGLESRKTKLKLQHLHPNIKVMRHPDHQPGSRAVILWAHHEKMVVVDQAIAFIGGLDICYGRWDDFKHRLTDLGSVAGVDRTLEKKKNILSTTSLEAYKQSMSIEETPTAAMPKQKSVPTMMPSLKHSKSFDLPDGGIHTVPESDPEFDDVDSGKGTEPEDTCEKPDNGSASSSEDSSPKHEAGSTAPDGNTPSVMGPKTDEDWVVPVTVVEERMAYLGVKGKARLWPGKDYCNFVAMDVIQPHRAFQDSVDRSTTPRMPWHDISAVVYGNAARDVARHFIQRWNSTKEEKNKQNQSYPYLMPRSNVFHSPLNIDKIKGSTKCTCQILRSVDNWSAGVKDREDSIHQAYLRVIRESQHYIYIENQFFISIAHSRDVANGIANALFERIMKAHREKATFRVYVVQPLLPSFMGEVGSDSGKAIHAILHWEYMSMCKGKDSLLERLKAHGVTNPHHYIVFNGLRNWGELAGELVTELVYIHSKLMIVDDNTVIIGSANINDRSLLGHRDSEIAVIVKDTETVDSVMNGKMYQAGVYALGLRKRLFEEHLGVLQGHWKQDVADPVSEYFFKGVWTLTASNNTINFEKVFHCVPTNTTRTFQQLRGYRVAPTLAKTDQKEAKKVLKNIRGFLVLTPLEFLCEEDLSPGLTTQEGIAPTRLWT